MGCGSFFANSAWRRTPRGEAGRRPRRLCASVRPLGAEGMGMGAARPGEPMAEGRASSPRWGLGTGRESHRRKSRTVAWCRRSWVYCSRPRWRRCHSCFILCCQVSLQRSLHTALRKMSRGLTFSRFQCIPAPLSRASTTSLLAFSTSPEPMGQPAA